jgi:hypothetical protein
MKSSNQVKFIEIQRDLMQTLKQEYRGALGYFMEEIFSKYLLKSNKEFVSSFNYLSKDIFNSEPPKPDAKLKINELIKTLNKTEYYRYHLYPIKTSIKLDYLMESNLLELARWERNRLVISEIKSKFGPTLEDVRLYPQSGQMLKFQQLQALGIETSIIVIIALPNPRFVEIPFSEFRVPPIPADIIEQFKNPKKRGLLRIQRINIRIPEDYRDLSKYKPIPKEVYSPLKWDSLEGLIKAMESN